MAGKPKPTSLKVIEGNLGKRPLPENEPRPRPEIPICPGDIDAKAKKVFRRLALMLTRIGLATEADSDMLAILCQTRSRLELIYRRLRRIDLDLKRNQKKLIILKKIPASDGENSGQTFVRLIADIESLLAERAFFMKEERLYSANFRMQAVEFGLSPRGRVGLVVGKGNPDDDEDLLS